MLNILFDSLLALTYPQVCHICAGSVENLSNGIVCENCWKRTRLFSGSEVLCKKCGAFLKDAEKPVETFCRQCDDHFYETARAVGIYEKALAACVIYLKKEPFVPKRLQKLFVEAFYASTFADTSLIVPVPLSKKRFFERGFNQAGVLAAVLNKETKIKVDEKSLERKIHTPIHRAAMDKKARAMTVENAFQTNRPEFIKGENILLVDDVFTSGATVSNCAKVLKKAGAGKVYVLTIARAV
jgi:ComF family protein